MRCSAVRLFRQMLCLALPLLLFACGKPKKTTSAPIQTEGTVENKGANFDVCALLKSEEIQAVQGSAVKETKSGGQSSAGLHTAQCFYSAEPFNKSISLAVTTAAPGSPNKENVTAFWKKIFGQAEHQDKEVEGEGDREKRESLRGQKTEKEREGEEEGIRPVKVDGVGDEGFWMGSPVGGALYVLSKQKNAFVRISLGGPDSNEAKIAKSKDLASKILDRL